MSARTWMLLAAVALLAGCGPEAAAPAGTPEPDAAEAAGFSPPPAVLSARREADGDVILSGRAQPEASLRLASPEGRAFAAIADETGAWSIEAPSPADVALFGLSAETAGRRVQAEGYIAVLPGPGPAAALLRAGAGALPIAPMAPRTTIWAVDIDAGGAAALTGTAPPNATLTALVDGAAAGQGRAAATNEYSLALTGTLAGGSRSLSVRGPDREASVTLPGGAPRPPQAGAFTAERFEQGWRIDWMTPGGGVQTTMIFAAEGAAQ